MTDIDILATLTISVIVVFLIMCYKYAAVKAENIKLRESTKKALKNNNKKEFSKALRNQIENKDSNIAPKNNDN